MRPDHLDADLRALAGLDTDVGTALARIGAPAARMRPPGFPALLRIIVGQQVSSKAAASMFARLEAACGPIQAARMAGMDLGTLQALGLSRQKAAYALTLARDVAEGRVDLDAVERLEDEDAVAELVKARGIGVWSAEIYLLFTLGRRDVFPAGDLALQIGFQRLKRLRKRPEPDRLRKLIQPWRPYRGAGAHFLWHFYAAPPLG
jgi:DNA-3-methyladenine glycosylase II